MKKPIKGFSGLWIKLYKKWKKEDSGANMADHNFTITYFLVIVCFKMK